MPVHLAYSPATPEYPPTHVQGSRKHEATSREQHPKRTSIPKQQGSPETNARWEGQVPLAFQPHARALRAWIWIG